MKRIHNHYGANQKIHHDPDRQLALTQRRASNARRKIRIAVIAFHRWIDRFHPEYDAATLLDLHPRTINRWIQRWIHSKLRSEPHGRPPVLSPVTDRRQVYHLLDALGPHIGCASLEVFFPLRRVKRLHG